MASPRLPAIVGANANLPRARTHPETTTTTTSSMTLMLRKQGHRHRPHSLTQEDLAYLVRKAMQLILRRHCVD